MPTIYWIRETAEDRFWESQPLPVFPNQASLNFTCPDCNAKFSSAAELRSHVGLNHPIGYPALVVKGRVVAEQVVLRACLAEADVALLNCSQCEVRIDGGEKHSLEPSRFHALFSASTNAKWDIRLTNSRPDGRSIARRSYVVQFRIPQANDLNLLDERFINVLAQHELGHSDLKQFEATLPNDAPAREYGSALGDYALAVHLKESWRPNLHPVAFEDFEVKMRKALDVLKHFQRPVALAVSSTIRFALNDFTDHGFPAVPQLELGHLFFRRRMNIATTSSAPNSAIPTAAVGMAHKVCPIDHVTHHLLIACSALAPQGTLTETQLQNLQQQVVRADTVSSLDRVKAHVICAVGYRRLKHADALAHLQEVTHYPIFRAWAQRQIEEIQTYGA